MKKRAISGILLALNIVLCLTIFILVIMIVKRGAKPAEEIRQQIREEQQLAQEQEAMMQAQEAMEEASEETESSSGILVCIPTSTSSVNVRSGPGTDYQRIGSAYTVNEYAVQGILDNGWTQIDYDGQTGFISSEYVEFRVKTISVETGAESYSDATSQDIERYRTSDYSINENPDQVDTVDYEQNTEENNVEANDAEVTEEEEQEAQDIIDAVTGTEE